MKISIGDRLNVLVQTLKEEIAKEHTNFKIEIIQLYSNDNHENYDYIKIEDITDIVCI